MAESLKLDRVSGALVARLTDNGPGGQGRACSSATSSSRVDGFEVGDSHSVLYRLTTRGIGNTAASRSSARASRVVVDVPLLPAPKPGKDDVRNLSGNHPFDGARVSNILPSVADELNLDETDGVVIVAVRSGGVAARLDFQPGDIIVQIGDDKITDVIALDELDAHAATHVERHHQAQDGRLMKLQMSGRITAVMAQRCSKPPDSRRGRRARWPTGCGRQKLVRGRRARSISSAPTAR